MAMNAFAALADNTRREIVLMLADQGVLSASEISQHFTMTAPAVSQHLKVLREANVVQVTKQGQKRLYRIDQSGLSEVSDWLSELGKLWNKRFDALDEYLLELNHQQSK